MTVIALTDLQMAIVNAAEWIIIIVIIALVIFGAKRVPELQDLLVGQLQNSKRLKLKRKKNFNGLRTLEQPPLPPQQRPMYKIEKNLNQ